MKIITKRKAIKKRPKTMKGQKTRQLEGETFAWEILQRN